MRIYSHGYGLLTFPCTSSMNKKTKLISCTTHSLCHKAEWTRLRQKTHLTSWHINTISFAMDLNSLQEPYEIMFLKSCTKHSTSQDMLAKQLTRNLVT